MAPSRGRVCRVDYLFDETLILVTPDPQPAVLVGESGTLNWTEARTP